MRVPTLEMVSKKAKQIDSAKNFSMKDEDIERVSRSKSYSCSVPDSYSLYDTVLLYVYQAFNIFPIYALFSSEFLQIIKEKEKFRKNPRNYAMTKSRLIREKVS